MWRRKYRIILGAILVLSGVCAWWYRSELASYYYAWCWQGTHGEEAAHHAARLVRQGNAAWPALRWLLARQTQEQIEPAAELLMLWLKESRQLEAWQSKLSRLAQDWPALGDVGQAVVLEAVCRYTSAAHDAGEPTPHNQPTALPDSQAEAWSRNASELAPRVAEFLLQTRPLHQSLARSAALRLAHWVVLHDSKLTPEVTPSPADETNRQATAASAWWRWCRDLAELGLLDERETVRAQAVRLAALPALQLQAKLSRRLLEPPGEPSATVRLLLLLAVGDAAAQDVAPSEDLARLLHDPDEEVRHTCEQVLRARGLTPRQIHLARLWTDSDPWVRAQVPRLLYESTQLDTAAWLERLSRDPEPVVRAAAIRAAGEHSEVRLITRLTELAQQDASPTVRQLASFYQRELFLRR
ncbi:MAG: HEAT repeat domain-containing protein [Gemmatales bacterium]|nr:HEAT repeat domain-containing protein [Gemmatales bacterium]